MREARLEDYAAIRALQRAAAPWRAPSTLRQLESQLHAFGAGQLVATCEGRVVGAAASLVLDWDRHAQGATWAALTAEGFFSTHEEAGQTLFAAELVADPSRRGFAVARALAQARRRLCRRLNLRRLLAAARLAGYRERSEGLSPERYAMGIVCGDIADAAMRFHLSQGFQYCGILHGFRPEDADSGGHAALLAWLNPLHAPPRPPALVASDGARKCA